MRSTPCRSPGGVARRSWRSWRTSPTPGCPPTAAPPPASDGHPRPRHPATGIGAATTSTGDRVTPPNKPSAGLPGPDHPRRPRQRGVRSSTSAAPPGCSHRPNARPSLSATASAPQTAAASPPPGAKPTTGNNPGPPAGGPISPTASSSARSTTTAPTTQAGWSTTRPTDRRLPPTDVRFGWIWAEPGRNRAALAASVADHVLVLELRPTCECCDKDLPPTAQDAMICTFECTFCRDCVETHLRGVCPNCGGGFASRPIRTPEALSRHPPDGTGAYAWLCICMTNPRGDALPATPCERRDVGGPVGRQRSAGPTDDLGDAGVPQKCSARSVKRVPKCQMRRPRVKMVVRSSMTAPARTPQAPWCGSPRTSCPCR